MKRLWITALAMVACAQSSAPAFEVASVKPHGAEDGGFGVKPPANGRFTATDCSAKLLLMLAYNVPESQIVGGPGWLDSEKWDIEARSAAEGRYSVADTRVMLQKLMAERFGLVVHRETRQVPVYVMTVSKGGVKFREAEAGRAPNVEIAGNSVRMASGEMAGLAQILATAVGRPVLDRTGLGKAYDLSLAWEDAPVKEGGVPGLEGAAEGGEGSVFTAMQSQLGLRLESQRASVEVIVVDKIERASGN